MNKKLTPEQYGVKAVNHGKQIIERTKILKGLMEGKTMDITKDPDIFLSLNKDALSPEQIMKIKQNEALDAAEAAQERRRADEKDFNPKSPAKWRQLGNIPISVYLSKPELWNNPDAIKSFLNKHPELRISRRSI